MIFQFVSHTKHMKQLEKEKLALQEENRRLKEELESLQTLRESLERMYADECDQHTALRISCGLDTEP